MANKHKTTSSQQKDDAKHPNTSNENRSASSESTHFSNKKTKIVKKDNWILISTTLTFFLSIIMSLSSTFVIDKSNLVVACIIIVIFIIINIVADTIGMAVSVVEEAPFRAMAAKKVKGASTCIWLIHSAEKVSNICSDVIGDICGILSGAAGAAVALRAIASLPVQYALIGSTIVAAIISAMTVGGKAIGKRLALTRAKDIVYATGRVLDWLHIGKSKAKTKK